MVLIDGLAAASLFCAFLVAVAQRQTQRGKPTTAFCRIGKEFKDKKHEILDNSVHQGALAHRL